MFIANLMSIGESGIRAMAPALHKIFAKQFIGSFKRASQKLALDFDEADDRVQGDQQEIIFVGIMIISIFCCCMCFYKKQLLISYLRPSKINEAKHAWTILAKRLRQSCPNVCIIFIGDSGFCRWRMLRWCHRHVVDYIVGIAHNVHLERRICC